MNRMSNITNTEQTCSWLVERKHITPWTPMSDEEDMWGPDEYEAEAVIEDCGAEVTEIEDGWRCAAGHHHYTYGSASQQAEERREAWLEWNNIEFFG